MDQVGVDIKMTQFEHLQTIMEADASTAFCNLQLTLFDFIYLWI